MLVLLKIVLGNDVLNDLKVKIEVATDFLVPRVYKKIVKQEKTSEVGNLNQEHFHSEAPGAMS